MQKKTYYKVVRNNTFTRNNEKTSSWMHAPVLCVYTPEVWTYAPALKGLKTKLFVFDDIGHAQQYAKQYSCYANIAIWECEVQNPTKYHGRGARSWFEAKQYWQKYAEFKKSKKSVKQFMSYIEGNTDIPLAYVDAILVDAVKLTKQIE